jgi:hypothetical protein
LLEGTAYKTHGNAFERAQLFGGINHLYSNGKSETFVHGVPLIKNCPYNSEMRDILSHLSFFLPEERTAIVENLQPVAEAYDHILKFYVHDGRFSSLLFLMYESKRKGHSRIAKKEITFEDAMRQIGVAFEAYEGNKAPTNYEEVENLVRYIRTKACDAIYGPRD